VSVIAVCEPVVVKVVVSADGIVVWIAWMLEGNICTVYEFTVVVSIVVEDFPVVLDEANE